MAGLSPTSRQTFTPPGPEVMLWSKIKSVTIHLEWTNTVTNYYSGGSVVTDVTTGSFDGAASNRIVAGQTPNTGNSDFFYFTAPMALGPMMGADVAIEFGFQASCIGSGSQSTSSTIDSGTPEQGEAEVIRFGSCSFRRTGSIGDSGQPTSESVLWTVAAACDGLVPPESLVIPWDDFDDGGVWTHSWEVTTVLESSRTDETGTFTINLIT